VKRPLQVILGAILFGLCWKTTIAFLMFNQPYFHTSVVAWQMAGAYLTPACLDSLGLGALLAYVEYDDDLQQQREKFLNLALIIGLLIVCFQTVIYLSGHALRLFWSTSYLGVSLIFVWLVGKAAQDRLSAWLEWPAVVYIGRISYGLYLYHNFILWAVRRFGFGLWETFILASAQRHAADCRSHGRRFPV